jgi:hypothetical protein
MVRMDVDHHLFLVQIIKIIIIPQDHLLLISMVQVIIVLYYKKSNIKNSNTYSFLGQTAPPITMQYSDEEVPCTLYLVRPGSRRIVSSNADNQRVTWILQVPPKPGYISVPNCVSVFKTSLTQLSVNYLNTDQSPASMSNGTALQFVSTSNMKDIGSFPEHVPAQMLQVTIDGAPAPLPPPSLEVHMIICYEPLSQVQVYTTNFAYT